MKKICLIIAMLCLLSSCDFNSVDKNAPISKKFASDIKIEFSADGVYMGFSDLPENYNSYKPETAMADGCFVIVCHEEDDPVVDGREHWDKFYEDSGNGKNSFLRVVHYVNGFPYFTDLYYVDGEYREFELNHERGLLPWRPWKYLRKLDSKINGKAVCYYVLTDDLELTYEDVMRAHTSSILEVINELAGKFQWLGFTTYLRYDKGE